MTHDDYEAEIDRLEQQIMQLEWKLEMHGWGLWVFFCFLIGAVVFPYLADIWQWIISLFGFY